MSTHNEDNFVFQTSGKLTIILAGIIAIIPILTFLVGIILILINNNDSSSLGLFLIIISVLGLITIPIFLHFYLSSKNIIIINSNLLEFQTYNETISYDLNEIKSIKLRFQPASSDSAGGGLLDVVVIAMEAVSQALKDENEKTKGKFTIEVVKADKKKNIDFLFVRFRDSFPVIEKISEITKIEPQKKKYLRIWDLSTS